MLQPASAGTVRRLGAGAEIRPDDGVSFRVWAPEVSSVSVVLEDDDGAALSEFPLTEEHGGYFSAVVAQARAGTLYRFKLGSSSDLLPDPASRYQPKGPHGPSVVIDPSTFAWSDQTWRGIQLADAVFYELHVGTFTAEGTWQAAAARLPGLAAIGVSAVEVMPIAEFGGEFGWGYDGVQLYAPTRLYGTPDDLRAFVDAAHRIGLGVILDVVYNHLGPDGNYLDRFSPRYFSTRYENEWGRAINFDDDASAVREFVIDNAVYWTTEFHLDGFRLDATQQIFDASATHILADVSVAVRSAARPRSVVIVAENEPQDVRGLTGVTEGGFDLDALWNDDFHHAAMVAATGRREAYYTDYFGTPQELISLAKWGFLYQGQRYSWQRQRRGTSALRFGRERFVTFLQNHDQVANSLTGRGERLHQLCGPGMYRALTAYWLLTPGTPMLFQGQEFGASAPFLFFADHQGELGQAVRAGRADFMKQFRSAAARDLLDTLPIPGARATFEGCKLDDAEREENKEMLAFHRDLIALRRQFGASELDGAVLSAQSFVLRFFDGPPRNGSRAEKDRLLIVNLGPDVSCEPAPEPLLAPPPGCRWVIGWSSEDPLYGGIGTAELDSDEGWRLPGHTTVLLTANVT